LLLLTCCALLYCATSLGQLRRTAIALVTGGADRELHARVGAELRALGWRVVEVAPGSDLALAQIARRAGTLAVLRVGQAAEGIEVWVAPEVDAEAKSEWVDVDPQRPDLAVVLAVEALRARFLEFGLEPEHSSNLGKEPVAARRRPGPAKPVVVSQPSRPPATNAVGSALWVGAGAAMLVAGEGVTSSAEIALRFLPVRWLGFDVAGWWPLSAAHVEATGGSAEMRSKLVLGAGELRWNLPEMSFGAGAGVGLAAVDLDGRADAGYVGSTDSLLTALPFGRLAFEVRVTRGLRVRMTSNVGASTPRAVIRFDERWVASWGRPFFALTLGIQGQVLGDVR
jgi:hypothetical protein